MTNIKMVGFNVWTPERGRATGVRRLRPRFDLITFVGRPTPHGAGLPTTSFPELTSGVVSITDICCGGRTRNPNLLCHLGFCSHISGTVLSDLRTSVRCMGEVSSAVEAILAGVAALQSASVEELSHREIVAEMSRLTTVAWMLPSVEHRLLQRLAAETEPCRLGESSWKKVLTTALRVSGKDATRRLDQAAALGPRRAMTGEPLAPRWEATATAQARGALGAEHVAIIAKFHKQLPGWVDVGTREVADAQLADLAAGLGPEALDKAAAALLMMIDQDGPEPSEKEPARHRSVTMGPQQRDGTRSIRGRLDAEAGAYWEAILAKEAAPGVNNPDDQSGGADDQSGADNGPGGRARTDIRTQAQRNHDAFTAGVDISDL